MTRGGGSSWSSTFSSSGPSVGFECLPRVVGQTKWVAQPGRIADLDQHMGELGTARDLPEPTVRVDARARVRLPGWR